MREFVIHNVDFIQIPVNPGDDKVYFPVSSHLEGKKILSIEYFSDEKGLDITGNFHLVKLDSSFVTLYDKEGNLVANSLYLTNFTGISGNNIIIDREIDWERSFISISDPIANSEILFFAVYIGDESLPIPAQRNFYNLSLPVSSPISEISLFRRVQALKGKKITGIYALSQTSTGTIPPKITYPICSYLYLVPQEADRFVNYIPIQLLSGIYVCPTLGILFNAVSFQTTFLEPTEINFDKSKILVRSTDNSIKTINLSFYYE